MTLHTRRLVAAFIMAGAASSLIAQTTGQTGRTPASTAAADANRVPPAPGSDDWQQTHRASKIIGTDVRNARGDKIGDIKDLVLDSRGSVAYAVVSTGGFLGLGDRLHAVPWNVLQTAPGRDYRVLDIDKERLKNAPSFDSDHWPNVSDDKWGEENRRYYQQGGTGTAPR